MWPSLHRHVSFLLQKYDAAKSEISFILIDKFNDQFIIIDIFNCKTN